MAARWACPRYTDKWCSEPLHVRPLAVPLGQSVDRERVTQVVQPRLVPGVIGTADLGVLPQSLEGILQRDQVNRGPTLAEEETPVVAHRRVRLPLAIEHTRSRHSSGAGSIGTNRVLKNLVFRMVRMAFGRSTSATDRFSASPARKPGSIEQ